MFLLAKAVAPAADVPRASTSLSAAGAFCQPRHKIHSLRLLALLLVILVHSAQSARAATSQAYPELRVATAFAGKFDADVFTAAWYVETPAWIRADRLELAAGVINAADVSRPFAFAGPVWRVTPRRRGPFVEFSFGLTVIGGSTVDGRDLGGNLHFRSAVALGLAGGRGQAHEVAIRVEHISNGGLRDHNPGLDSIGLSFVILMGGHAGQ